MISIISSTYYVAKASSRLLSPQRLFNAEKLVTGRFIVEEYKSILVFNNVAELVVDYDPSNHLSVFGKNQTTGVAEVKLGGLLEESNTNLAPAKKLLLHWHIRVGHKSMSRVQAFFRAVPFLSERFKVASRITYLPLCETCQ